MKVIVLPLCLALMESAAVAAPKSAIDPRVTAIFGRVQAHYRRLKSFSIIGHETIVGNGNSRFGRVETSLQFPYRARLQMDSTDANGKITVPRTRRLIGTKSYQRWDLNGDNGDVNANQFTALDSDKARAEALKTIYLPSPDLALSIFTVTAGGNLAKMPNLQKVTLAKKREGQRLFDVITLLRRDPGDPNPIELQYFISPRYEIEKFVLRRKIRGQDFVATTLFEPLKLNWKGSQGATDAAAYNWKTLAVSGMDAPAFQPKAVVSVEPKARQIFARAATLYGDLQGLQLEWKEQEFDPQYGKQTNSVKVAYDAKGRLRLETPQGLDQLLITDGKTQWTVDQQDGGASKPKVTYKSESIDEDDAVGNLELELQFSEAEIGPFSQWLRSENALEAENVATSTEVEKLREIRAVVLPSQLYENQPCDLVQITTRFDDKYTFVSGETVKQETYWFALGDGRLVRLQTSSQEGKQKPKTSDWQITRQNFNPQFDAKTFVFTPPPGAVREK